MKKILPALYFACSFLFCWETNYGQVAGNPELKTTNPMAFPADKSPTRLSPELKKLSDQGNGAALRSLISKPGPANNGLDPYMQIQGNNIVIDVTVKGNMNAAKAELQK